MRTQKRQARSAVARGQPGLLAREAEKKQDALQDPLNRQPIKNNTNNVDFTNDALQDFLIAQPPVLLGLITNFTGNTLQDNMVITLQRMQKLGQEIACPSGKPA